MENENSRRSISKGTKNEYRQYSIDQKYKALKILQMNMFNYTKTEQDTAVSVVTLKKWKEKYPEAFNNKYQDGHLAKIEATVAVASINLVTQATDLVKRALERADKLLDKETNLDKISNFIKAITPITNALNEGEGGNKTVSSIKSTMEKLAKLNSLEIEDVESTDVT